MIDKPSMNVGWVVKLINHRRKKNYHIMKITTATKINELVLFHSNFYAFIDSFTKWLIRTFDSRLFISSRTDVWNKVNGLTQQPNFKRANRINKDGQIKTVTVRHTHTHVHVYKLMCDVCTSTKYRLYVEMTT